MLVSKAGHEVAEITIFGAIGKYQRLIGDLHGAGWAQMERWDSILNDDYSNARQTCTSWRWSRTLSVALAV